jgi:hypothetical protein
LGAVILNFFSGFLSCVPRGLRQEESQVTTRVVHEPAN